VRFLGQFRNRIDGKGRLSVPGSFRRKLDPNDNGTFVLQKGMDSTIEVHPLSEYSDTWDRQHKNLPRYQKRSRLVRLMRYGFAGEVNLDSQGRILVPRPMLEDAGIKDEAVVVGFGEYFEVWEPKRFEERAAEAGESYDDNLAYLERRNWEERPEDVESAEDDVS